MKTNEHRLVQRYQLAHIVNKLEASISTLTEILDAATAMIHQMDGSPGGKYQTTLFTPPANPSVNWDEKILKHWGVLLKGPLVSIQWIKKLTYKLVFESDY